MKLIFRVLEFFFSSRCSREKVVDDNGALQLLRL